MAFKFTNSKGKEIVLLNPGDKGRKYSMELKAKADLYTGEKLSPTRSAFRSGYLKSREDSARAWCAKNGRKYRKGSGTKFQ